MSVTALESTALLSITDSQRRSALTHAEIGSWMWDFAGGYFSMDARWCALMSLDPCPGRDHLLRWARNVHPDDLFEFQRRLEELRTTSSADFECEYRILTLDSRWLWILHRGQVIEHSPDGRPLRACGVCIEIDLRKQAEVASQENEARLATALWGARAAFWQWQVATEAMQMSPLWFAMTGYSREQWEGVADPWMSRIHPEDQASVRQQMLAHLQAEAPAIDLEYRILTGNGLWKWMLTRGRAVAWDFEGRATVAIGVSLDINTRKEAELRTARTQQDMLETVAGSSADWLLLVDRNRRCIFLNRELHGVSAKDGVGHLIEEFAPLADRTRIAAIFERVMSSGEPHDFEQQAQAGVGQGSRYCEWRVRPARTGSQISGAVANITEVTERRTQRDALHTQTFILETLREGVLLVDSASQTIRLTNAALDSMFGYHGGELLGQSVRVLPGLPAVQREHIERSLRDGSGTAGAARPLEFECTHRDGRTFNASCVFMPLRRAGLDHWLAVISDVTERKPLEREILQIAGREQQRIGSDLHDGLGQELTGVALLLRGIAARLDRDASPLSGELEEVIAQVNRAIADTRELARGILPVSIEGAG